MTLDSELIDPAESLVLAARPRWSSQAIEHPPLPLQRRIVILTLIVLGHVLFFWWMAHWSGVPLPVPAEDVTSVLLLSLPRPPPPSPVKRKLEAVIATPAPIAPPRPRVMQPAPRLPGKPGNRPMRVVEIVDRDPDKPLTLFRADGSIDLPEDVAADLKSVTSEQRQFSYQLPGLASAKSFARRPQALVYEATRFDEHWIDEKDIVAEALDKVAEKTTVTIKIPIPRSPGSKVVCKVSLLAVGGACAIVNNGQGYVVALNDPETLNDEEDKQCRQWWEEIVKATTAEKWLELQDRYDAQCRKPLATSVDVPLQ